MDEHYCHLCANGADVRNFIICEADYSAVFNMIGVCAANSGVIVVSFSIEDSHPHVLLYGTRSGCACFKNLFETLYRHFATKTRDGSVQSTFHCELYWIGDEDYLRNVGVYTVIQATKDGKPVMPYDYRWGTGSMYFRSPHHIPLWLIDDDGIIHDPVPFGSLPARDKRRVLHSRRYTIPDSWSVCNGLILPENYIDIERFESIYRTHNRFRVFMASPRKVEQEMLARMSAERGVAFEDMEARHLCGAECKSMFGTRDPRRLDGRQRILLAQRLRSQYRLTFRQIATVVYLPESEIRTYVR